MISDCLIYSFWGRGTWVGGTGGALRLGLYLCFLPAPPRCWGVASGKSDRQSGEYSMPRSGNWLFLFRIRLSFAGNSDRLDVNRLIWLPILVYWLPNQWYLGLQGTTQVH